VNKKTPVIEMRDMTKVFPGVIANDHINLAVYEGEVLGLLGENGAGKSVLMSVLYGLYPPTEGEIFVRGKQVDITEPKVAIEHGIGMVHQHFMLVPPFTVAENIILGSEPRTGAGTLDIAKADSQDNVPGRASADSGRADSSIDAAGDQGAVQDYAQPDRIGRPRYLYLT